METLAVELLPQDSRYRPLRDIDGIQWDLRYASDRNLLGRDLYSPHDCAWLHREAAQALDRAAAALRALRPDLELMVLDAARPHRVQQLFWEHVRGTPMQRYFADPARGSIHSYGMAVDLTLVDRSGTELDMGSEFDDTSERSHPEFEQRLLAERVLHPGQLSNRQVLRQVMEVGQWRGIATEWWHFELGDRDTVRRDLPLLI